MKTTRIDTTCGIYESETTIRDYGHKICVTEPYIKWDNNSGILDYEKWTTTDAKKMALLRAFADAEALALDDGSCWDQLEWM